MPSVYVLVEQGSTNSIFYTQTHLLFETLKKAGAIVCVGDEFLSASPERDDRLIVYGAVDPRHHDKIREFDRNNRWYYVVDEQTRTHPGPYRRAVECMRDLEISNMVVTYQNAKHLEYLTNQCVKYLVMPQCVEAIRPLIKKENDVLISGQMDPSFFDPNDMSNPCYVTRTRISNALRRALPEQTTLLQYPGMVLSEAWHARVGVGYLETLDRFRLAVVCKASKYDRFVGKYVEMGASHVLPVGDCPSYMPTEMKRAMLDVETMSDVDAITEIKRLIASPAELKQRSDVYSNEVGKRYLSLPNIRCLLWDMLH